MNTQISIHNVDSSAVSLRIVDHGWFATVKIDIGDNHIVLFAENGAEAIAIVGKLGFVSEYDNNTDGFKERTAQDAMREQAQDLVSNILSL